MTIVKYKLWVFASQNNIFLVWKQFNYCYVFFLQKCMANCVDRYIDTAKFVQEKYIQKLQQQAGRVWHVFLFVTFYDNEVGTVYEECADSDRPIPVSKDEVKLEKM